MGKPKHDWATLDPIIDNLKSQGLTDTQIAKDLGIGRQTLVDRLRSRGPNTGAVEVLPGQVSLEEANTPAEVHIEAVSEFDALPAGYAKSVFGNSLLQVPWHHDS